MLWTDDWIAQAAARRLRQAGSAQVARWQQQRGFATPSEPYDAIIIGGGECAWRNRSGVVC